MRLRFLVWAVTLGLLCGPAAVWAANLTFEDVSVGLGGMYRPQTLVPIAVRIRNNGDDLRGEFRVTTNAGPGVLPDHYQFPAYLPKGTKQRHFLYVWLESYTNELTVEFWSKGQRVAAGGATNCRVLNPNDRLIAVVGGTGSSLQFLNGQSASLPIVVTPRPWDIGHGQTWLRESRYMRMPVARPGMPGRSPMATGTMYVTTIDKDALPDNPEGYAGASMLALMSDVTENTLGPDARTAITLWVTSGGHLLLAGGGVPGRLDAPFFTALLAGRAAAQKTLVSGENGTAITTPVAAGHLTTLDYDPDAVTVRDWAAATRLYGSLVAQDPRWPVTFNLRETLNKAVMPLNLRPPDLKLIVIFLLVYLVLLVPVNYFVLKRMDKRELAWVTTPVIVLLFTVGAYGIGYATKGNRLVLNTVTVVESTAGQGVAEAVSELLIFSPSRSAYTLHLGNGGLLAREMGTNESSYSHGGYSPRERETSPLTFSTVGQGMTRLTSVEQVRVDMWAFRQFMMAHRLDLGGGFSAQLTKGRPATDPRATGTVTNHTPYHLALCELYVDGALVNSFALDPGQTVTVENANAPTSPRLTDDEKHVLTILQKDLRQQCIPGAPLAKGYVLIGYSNEARLPLTIDRRTPTNALTVMVVHL